MAFTYRNVKGAHLTYQEVDDNFMEVSNTLDQCQAYATAAGEAAAMAAEDAVAVVELEIQGYVTDAQNAANLSEQWSNAPEDTEVEPGLYSAFHWAKKAEETVATGVIDDASVAIDKTWSAQKLARGGFDNVTVTASQSLSRGQYIQIAQEASSVTVTLPATFNAGDEFIVGNLTSRSDHVIAMNGHKVRGQIMSGDALTLDISTRSFLFKYIDATYGLELFQ